MSGEAPAVAPAETPAPAESAPADPAPAAVVARFSSFRSVPTRGVTVLIMDVPIERAPTALEALGSPVLGESIHVGFIRIDPVAIMRGEPVPPVLAAEGEPPSPAINGTLESYRMVGIREALALTIEVPLERAHLALKHLSMPTPRSRILVAIARLKGPPAEPSTLPRGAVRTPGQLAVQRCALRVKDPPFQRWRLGSGYIEGDPDGNEQETIVNVRLALGIKSRAELAQNHEKLQAWLRMEAEFELWLQEREPEEV